MAIAFAASRIADVAHLDATVPFGKGKRFFDLLLRSRVQMDQHGRADAEPDDAVPVGRQVPEDRPVIAASLRLDVTSLLYPLPVGAFFHQPGGLLEEPTEFEELVRGPAAEGKDVGGGRLKLLHGGAYEIVGAP